MESSRFFLSGYANDAVELDRAAAEKDFRSFLGWENGFEEIHRLRMQPTALNPNKRSY